MAEKQADAEPFDVEAAMAKLGQKARAAGARLATASTEAKNAALLAMAEAIRARRADILDANADDMKAAESGDLSSALRDRLKLDESRVEAMAAGIEAISRLPDPVGGVMAEWDRPNGLHIARVRVPIGVIGIVYESRPNVTADAGALCLKSGNAVILRGGSESFHSNRMIHACLTEGLKTVELPEYAVQLVPTTDRAAVGALLSGLDENIDLIIPRGGKSLIARVQQDACVPVLGHLEGLCHIYVDGAADLDMARKVTLNAKMRRPGICGAAETLLIDRACAGTHLAPIISDLLEAGCEVRGDPDVLAVDRRVMPATEADWSTEYLEAIISAKLVNGVDGAIAHISFYGSQHTESILTEDAATAERFLHELDSAILLHNASTQFADGGEFGMGAEIGIATGKLHARGPVGLEELTTYKYLVRGHGQTRP